MRRFLYAGLTLLAVFLLVMLDREGYRDSAGGGLSVIDALYYATVTVSTTGYGDIVPVSEGARLVNIVAITPLRLIFLVILVGTTLEVLTKRTGAEFRLARWRSRLKDHTVIVGYGTKGHSAANALVAGGRPTSSIVVVDPRHDVVGEANAEGFAGVQGDATRSEVLKRAAVEDAREVIVATQRDDTAVLVVLTARQLNPRAFIAAAVREAENEPLLRQSGANAVITSSETAGRLLGMATESPAVSEVIEELLVYGTGLDLAERQVRPDEVGREPAACEEVVLAVVRQGQILRFDDHRAGALAAGDRVVVIETPGRS